VEARPPSAGYRLKKFVRRHPLELALAGTVALLFLGGVAVAWWQNEQASARRETDVRRQLEDEQRSAADNARLARNAEAVTALLGQCEEALKAGDAAKAAVALEAARKRSAEGGAQEQAQRLGRRGADLDLLRDLDAIDQFRWTPVENQLPDPAAVAVRTREALRRFGANPDAVSEDQAAARVSASAVRESIVAALDRLLRQEKTAGARAVLRLVDADAYRDAVRDAFLAADPAKIVELAGREAALEQPPGFVAFLGESGAIGVERRRRLLEAAVSRRPGDLGLVMTLGYSYPIDQEDGANERLRWFQAAVAAAPTNPAALNSLGAALGGKGQMDEAIASLRKAIDLDPKYAGAHLNLGTVLCDVKRDYDGAIACFREAIALDPKPARVHYNLGVALAGKSQWDEAIASYQKAIDLDPKLPRVHTDLGLSLKARGQVDDAIACFQRAIALDPKDAKAHTGLGVILCDSRRDCDGAIACFRQAIALVPRDAKAHYYLGNALGAKGQLEEAIACFRQAIALGPKDAGPHYNLGNALRDKGQLNEAIASYQKAIALDPKYAQAHCNLGHALARRGRFVESLAALNRGHELGTKQPGWRYPSAEWVRQAEAKAAMEAKLPAFLKGEFRPGDNKERLVLAIVCQFKKFHHTTTGLYAAAFAADPKLGDDLRAAHRYNAACCASLAAAGTGEDAGKLDGKERARLRKQALDWLETDLTGWNKLLDSGPPQAWPFVVQFLSHWQKDPDLAGIRDKTALDKLPAEEQKAFGRLWADVAALLKKAEQKRE
jgi:tetratricopeptide (TPR) repeat protein